jgi:diacylglycerol kinase (ATP)
MKIAMLFNHGAGHGASLAALRETLTRAGHQIVRVIDSKADAHRLAEPPAELAVAAGGDGTVAAAARALAGTQVPLAVLPIGTANNVAFTLGVEGSDERIAAGWHTARPRPFDLGLLHGAWGSRRFIEGVGGGLVEACMRAIEQRPVPDDEPPPWQLVRAVRRYTEALARLDPRPWDFSVDGSRRTGDFLLVEVLNGRAVGPNLELAPDASPFDGRLAVVTARAEDREVLAAYLADLLGGRESRLQLPVEPATHVEIVTPHPLHVDDALLEASSTGTVSIEIEPGALIVLTPAT